MRIPRLPFIKICCITSAREADMAVSAGASALGFVSAMPSGPGVIDDHLIAEIAATVPPPLATFLLTSRQDAESIIDQHRICCTSTIQMVDHVEHAELIKLRRGLPGIRLVQVVHVSGEESIEEAKAVAPLVDALLLDSGNRNLPVKVLGGTGQIHDWSVSRRIRNETSIPLFLAGGLNAANIANAINHVKPFGIDLCSSVRTKGRLDGVKLRTFIAAVAGCSR